MERYKQAFIKKSEFLEGIARQQKFSTELMDKSWACLQDGEISESDLRMALEEILP